MEYIYIFLCLARMKSCLLKSYKKRNADVPWLPSAPHWLVHTVLSKPQACHLSGGNGGASHHPIALETSVLYRLLEPAVEAWSLNFQQTHW